MDLRITPNFNTNQVRTSKNKSNPNFGTITFVNKYADSFNRVRALGDEPRDFLRGLIDVAEHKLNNNLLKIAVKDVEYVPWGRDCTPSKMILKLVNGREYSVHRRLLGIMDLSHEDTIIKQLQAIESQEAGLMPSQVKTCSRCAEMDA